MEGLIVDIPKWGNSQEAQVPCRRKGNSLRHLNGRQNRAWRPAALLPSKPLHSTPSLLVPRLFPPFGRTEVPCMEGPASPWLVYEAGSRWFQSFEDPEWGEGLSDGH